MKQDCSNSTCNIPSKWTFSVDTRVEFTVYIDSNDDVCKLMSEIGDLKINIVAYMLITSSCYKNTFRFIPGGKTAQSIPEIEASREIIEKLKYKYCEKQVLKVSLLSGGPGGFAKALCTVNNTVDIYYSYISEDGDQIFETSSNCKAIEAIKNLN